MNKHKQSLEIVEMTNEEALEMMDEWSMGIITGISDKCLSKALQALEKQIPKKPYVTEQTEQVPIYDCSVCGRRLKELDDYCSGCGNKVDWSDVE